jgi:hypothetical protein
VKTNPLHYSIPENRALHTVSSTRPSQLRHAGEQFSTTV